VQVYPPTDAQRIVQVCADAVCRGRQGLCMAMLFICCTDPWQHVRACTRGVLVHSRQAEAATTLDEPLQRRHCVRWHRFSDAGCTLFQLHVRSSRCAGSIPECKCEWPTWLCLALLIKQTSTTQRAVLFAWEAQPSTPIARAHVQTHQKPPFFRDKEWACLHCCSMKAAIRIHV
jgi:hypothetical protein